MTQVLHTLRGSDYKIGDDFVEFSANVIAIDHIYLVIDRDQQGFMGRRQMIWTLMRAAITEVWRVGDVVVLRLPMVLFTYALQIDLATVEPAGRA